MPSSCATISRPRASSSPPRISATVSRARSSTVRRPARCASSASPRRSTARCSNASANLRPPPLKSNPDPWNCFNTEKSTMDKKIRVLVVDDSAVRRQLLTEILDSDPGIEVVGTAPDPYVAREKIKLLNPDVLTLDVEMPRMDGLAFLRNLMRLRPMPVVMCSSLTQKGAAVALDALSLGAVDFVAKPTVDVIHGIKESSHEMVSKVKMAARAQIRPLADSPASIVAESHDARVLLPKRRPPAHFATSDSTIAI